MATYVLIPGAWHGAWCFEQLIPLLGRQGHTVLTPELAGTGADRTALSEVTFEAWVQSAARLISAQLEPVILVGHSRGGVVISQVAETVPEHIRCLVFLAAGMPLNGQTMIEAAFNCAGETNTHSPPLVIDGLGMSLRPEKIVDMLYHMVEPEMAQAAAARLRPEPVFSISTRVSLSPERYGRVPRVYIECVFDRAVPIEAQRRMQLASTVDKVISLETDHSPFLCAPELLAEALLSLNAEFPVSRQGRVAPLARSPTVPV